MSEQNHSLENEQLSSENANSATENTRLKTEVKEESIADKILRQVAERKKKNQEKKKSAEAIAEKKVVEQAEETIETASVKEEVPTVQAEEAVVAAPETEEVVTEQAEETIVAAPETEEVVVEQAEETAVSAPETEEVVAEQAEETVVAAPETEKVVAEQVEKSATVVEELPDYSTYSPAELVEALKTLLEEKPVQTLKKTVDIIKSTFYRHLKADFHAKRKEFIEAGGKADEFKHEPNEFEAEFKELLKQYREARTAFAQEIEKKKQDNASAKHVIIEKINELTQSSESINKTFEEFRDLQKQWHVLGQVPQAVVNSLWDSYNFAIEKFYNYVSLNKELRDLDLKKNLEKKILLCEKAEELLLVPMVVQAFKELQKLHDQWRETGPVPYDKKEEIWERFKEATTSINKKHHEYFEEIKEEELNNLKAKTLICEKAEELAALTLNSHKEWEKNSKEIIELQKLWKLIGFAPKKDNNAIYERFRVACDTFFEKKRAFYEIIKNEQLQNLQLKTELVLEAEAEQTSTEWKKSTQLYIEIQKKWKTIGPTSRKSSDAIWKRFRAACNTFFENKSKHFASLDGIQKENLKLKQELLEKVRSFESSGSQHNDLDMLKQFQKEFTEIGHVPFKEKDKIQKDFRQAINACFKDLKIDDNQRHQIRFRERIDRISGSNRSGSKMRVERDKIFSRIQKLESDIILWENNIGFFAKSKSAEVLIAGVQAKIGKAKEQVKSLHDTLSMIDNSDD